MVEDTYIRREGHLMHKAVHCTVELIFNAEFQSPVGYLILGRQQLVCLPFYLC